MSSNENDNAPYSPRTGRTDDTVSLLDLLAVIAKRKWFIIGVTGVVAVVLLVLLVASKLLPVTSRWNFFPDRYKPTVIILLQSSQGSSVSSILSQSGLGALGGLLGSGGAGATSANLVTALLGTNSILDTVAAEFDIAGRYHLVDMVRTRARKAIAGSVSTTVDETSGMMRIGFEDTDREFATKVVNRLVDLVGREFTRLSVSRVLDKERDLSDQLATSQAEAARLQDKLIAFQTRYGVYDITQQTSANIQAIAGLRTQIMNLQISLNSQSKYLPQTDYRIVQIQDQIAGLQKAIDALTEGSSDLQTGIVPQKRLMSLASQYQVLVRDITVAQTIVGTLKSQLEATRVEELTRSQAFQIVELAEVPEVRSSPQRARTAVIATFAVGVVSILIAFIAEYFARAKQDPLEAGKLQVIKDSFTLRRRKPANPPR